MKPASSLLVALTVLALTGSAFAQESFDTTPLGVGSVPAGWTTPPTGGANQPWTCRFGQTPSVGTGPSGDLCDGGNYLYCETSGAGSLGTFVLTAPVGTPAGNLQFHYHMSGETMGTLIVEEDSGTGFQQLWSAAGDQTNRWHASPQIACAGGDIRFIYTAAGGFTGDCAIDQISLPGDPDNLPYFTENNALSTLLINGGTNVTLCEGDTVTVTAAASAANPGALFDVGVNTGTIVSSCGGGVQLANDAINLPLSSSVSFRGGASPNLAPMQDATGAVSTLNLSFLAIQTAPIHIQMGLIDFADPDGIAMSGVASFSANQLFGALTLGDDDNIQITGTPLCGTPFVPVSFYGTSYDHCFINSNGDVSFIIGHTNFQPTATDWQTNMPRIGVGTDHQPNFYGSIAYTQLADGFRVSYADVGEWGTGGGVTASYDIEVSASQGALISGLTVNGTWLTSTVVGISAGSIGTNPPLVSFDAVSGLGAIASSVMDSRIDANILGMITGAGTTVNNIQFPNADGSSMIVN